ncbi:MAG TPA: hypothetical protein VLG49_00270 [Rhabdochlamydiaceae bacterium]|nr:hypothetical protein [Rhabdochlamydiaceae bacterium]
MFKERIDHHEKEHFNFILDSDTKHSSHKAFIQAIYFKLNQFERHFELITTKYKNIALTWLLATYAAVGFLLSNEAKGLIDHLSAVSIICFIGLVGVSLIWHLDMNVYHRFWSALFIEEVIMEEKYPHLLQSKTITLLIDKSREKFFTRGAFYFIADILLVITMAAAVFPLIQHSSLYSIIGTEIGFLVFLILLLFFMIKYSNKLQKSFSQLLEIRRKNNSSKSSNRQSKEKSHHRFHL